MPANVLEENFKQMDRLRKRSSSVHW